MSLSPVHVLEVATGKPAPKPRRFHLERAFDERVATIAAGVRFPSGRVVMEWLTEPGCIAFFNSEDEVRTIHGHGSRTRFVWDDASEGTW